MENRYINRFKGIGATSAETIKSIDTSGNLTERLREAQGSLRTQSENTKKLVATAQEMITNITTFQDMVGRQYVVNLGAPTPEIMASPGKQLGYVQLVMRFLQAGMVHFIEELHNAGHRIDTLEKHIGRLAMTDQEIDYLGELQSLEISDLEAPAPPPTPPSSVTSPANSPSKQSSAPDTPITKDAQAKDSRPPSVAQVDQKQSKINKQRR